jgi:aerobic-type carbon monoxide dehydrogenase small subunit (CoxS/CutS family)
MPVKFIVNGKPAEFDGPDDVPLLWVVREHLGLTGSKFGCGIGACGACTMHIDVPRRARASRRSRWLRASALQRSKACRPTTIIPFKEPGLRSTFPNAAIASPE